MNDRVQVESLGTGAVQSTSLAFQRVHDVHGGDGLSFGMSAVGDRISKYTCKETFEYVSDLFVDETADALDTPATSESTYGGLGDAEDLA